MLRKQEGDFVSEYAVDPAQIALALSAKVRFDTGLLSSNTLLVRQEGVVKTVVEYREPQMTGIYMEGSESALRVPMIGLVMIRTTRENKSPNYAVYAVKKRPTAMDEPMFHAPLPNIYNHGGICWGSVKRVTDAALKDTDLKEDWAMLFGSPFGNHATTGKSRRQPSDIRKLLIELHERKARAYPKSDLKPADTTLAKLVKDEK